MAAGEINRPQEWGPGNRRSYIASDGEVSLRAQNDGNGNAIYIGRAKVGTLESEAKWQVSYQEYDGNNAVTLRTWPQNALGNASSNYEFVWTDRAGYTYS